jgi:hypothetical protein
VADSSSEMIDRWLQMLSHWLDRGGPDAIGLGVVAFFIALPVLVLAHELGHAVIGLVRTEGLVRIRVGRAPGRIHGRVGRLAFELNLVPAGGDVAGTALTFARMSRGEQVAYALSGPAAECLFLALLLPALQLTGGGVHEVLVWAWGFGLLQALLTSFPPGSGTTVPTAQRWSPRFPRGVSTNGSSRRPRPR